MDKNIENGFHSIDYSSFGTRITPSSTTSSYASSDRFGYNHDISSNAYVGGFASHDSSKAGGSGYGAGITFGFRF